MAFRGRVRGALAGAAPAALLVAAFATLFFDVLVRGQTFLGSDPARHHFPLLSLVRPLWRLEGGLPLWNPLLAAGQPWAANPEQAAFHPLTWLFLVLPPTLAFRLQILVPVAAAMAGAAFLGRALRLPRVAATALALAWGAGGAFVSSTQFFPALFAGAALPWVLGFAARVACGGGASAVVGLAVAEAFLCVAGEPTQLLLSGPLAILTGWQALRACSETGAPSCARRLVAARTAHLAAGLALGALIAAPTLLPGAFHARKTVRADGLPEYVASFWSAPPWRAGELLLPSVLGRESVPSGGEAARDAWRDRLYPGRGQPYLASVYPGLVATLLATFAWWRGVPGARAWGAAGLLAAVVAAGSHGPLWAHLRKLPLLDGTRYPEKLLLAAAFAVAVSAALGLAALAEAPARTRRGFGLSAAVLALLLLAGWGLGAKTAGAYPAQLLAEQALSQAAVAAAAAALLLLVPETGRGRTALCGLLVVLFGADLALRGRPLLQTGAPRHLLGLPPQFEALRRHPPRGYLVHAAAWTPELWKVEAIGEPPAMARFGIASALDYDFGMTELAWSARATETIFSTIARAPDAAGPVLRRRSVAGVIRFRPGAPRSRKEADRVPRAELLELLALRDPLPFAFLATEARPVRDAAEWSRTVVALGEGAATTACVDAAHAGALPPRLSGGRAAVLDRRPGSLRIEVAAEGPNPAFLAVNQTWDSGWRATVGGRPAPLLLTDLSLSGLVVPPGRHEVVLRYEDPAVSAGLALGAAGLVACAALALRGRRSLRTGAVSSDG
jgi:hypothetical protein